MEKIKIKRAQVSIFVIISIVVIAIVILIVFMQINSKRFALNAVPNEVKPINNFIQNCIEKSAIEDVYFIGDSGGYYNLPNLSTENNVAYYYYEKKNYMPSKERIQKEMELFMKDRIFLCTKNFVNFPDYVVKGQEIKTNVEILNESVIFKVNYPVSVTKDEKTYGLENFETSVKIGLGRIYEFVKYVTEEQMTHEDVCMDCISNAAFESNVYVSMRDYRGGVVFGVMDLENGLEGEDYWFYFANKY